MTQSSTFGLALVLIVAIAQGAQPLSPDPLFQVDGSFRDAAVSGDHLYLLAGGVAVGQPDVLVWLLSKDGLGRQVGEYRAR